MKILANRASCITFNVYGAFVDAYEEHLKAELSLVESENRKISNEIEDLKRTYVEGKEVYVV